MCRDIYINMYLKKMWGIFNAAATHLSTWRLALWWSASHTLHVWRQDPQMKRRISDHRIHQKSSIPKPWPGQWTPEVQIKWFGTHSERKKPKSSCKNSGHASWYLIATENWWSPLIDLFWEIRSSNCLNTSFVRPKVKQDSQPSHERWAGHISG